MYRIIAADDDFSMRHVYAEILESLGHEAVICGNGHEAVRVFKEKPSDLLILDINMPVMDGLEACREIRRLPEGLRVPVIIVSSNDTEEDVAAGFNAGADDYMIKPIRETVLLAKLKNFLKTAALYSHEFDLVKNHILFQGRYRIEKVLGYGAHSVVFLAEDETGKIPVAIKLLNETASSGPLLQAMVEKIIAMQEIDSSGLVKILDYGRYNEQIFIVLEYIDGCDLQKRLSLAPVKEKEAIGLATEVLAALHAMDEAGLCHLDIKPENIMLSADGGKLADFGLVTPRQTATMPVHGELWGTIAYAAPEGFTDAMAGDIRSDIYSFGIVLYESVTGDNPFLSEKPSVTMFRQLNLTPPRLAELGLGFSIEFSDLVAAMLAKLPDERPSLDELCEVFDNLALCYANEEHPAALRFPVPEPKEKSEAESRPAPVPASPPPQRLPALPRARKKRFGDRVFERMLKRPGRFGGKRDYRLGPVVFLSLICVVLFSFSGQTIFAALSGDPTGAIVNLPILNVQCHSCGHAENVFAADIAAVRCRRCRGQVGYAMKCGCCEKPFAWNPPDSETKNADPADVDALVARSRNCPSCKSKNTSYIAPPAHTGRNQGGK